VASSLTAVAAVIKNASFRFEEQVTKFVPNVINLILQTDYLNSDNVEVLAKCLLINSSLSSLGLQNSSSQTL
jgi:hypothetical protein